MVILRMEGTGWSEWALDLIPNWQGCWNPLTCGIVRSLVEISYSGWGSGTSGFGKRWWFCCWTGLRFCLWRCPIGRWKCRTKRGGRHLKQCYRFGDDLHKGYHYRWEWWDPEEGSGGSGERKREEACVPWYLEEETVQQRCHREE